jgi:YD repeat-containing protein
MILFQRSLPAVERTSFIGYDAVDNITSTTDALGRETDYDYDALNRETSMTEAVGTARGGVPNGPAVYGGPCCSSSIMRPPIDR